MNLVERVEMIKQFLENYAEEEIYLYYHEEEQAIYFIDTKTGQTEELDISYNISPMEN